MVRMQFAWRAVLVLPACAAGDLRAAEPWKPAAGPLMTRWAAEVSPGNALPEYPRPLMVRKEWMSLNGLWDYAIADRSVDKAPGAYEGRILVPFCIESALSGVMKPLRPDQRLWYRRAFAVPPAWKGRRILLHVGAADWESQVWLDGRKVDSHRGGYDAFMVDLTAHLKGDGPHELVIAVADPTDAGWQMRGKQVLKPGGAAYTACSGLWQTVWLEPVPMAAVDALRLVGDPATGALHVTVDARTPPDPSSVTVRVFDGPAEVARADAALGAELVGGVKENLTWYKATRAWVTATLDLRIPSPKPWSPDTPFLYDVTVELKGKDGATADAVRSYAGLRTVAVGKDEKGVARLLLNGQPTVLPGALDQGFWPDGIYTAPTDAALRYDVEAAKELGLAAIRKHIKVEPERFYYWADRLGLMVLQDLPSGAEGDPFTDQPVNNEAAAQGEMERRRLIRQRWNHPSIVCWVMFNEGWGQHDTLRNAAWAKALDPTRLIDEASGFPRHGGGDVHDVHGGNAPKEPNRIGIDTETLGVGLAVAGHMWPGKLWGTGTYDAATGGMKEGWDPAVMDEAAKAWYTRLCRTFYRGLWANREATGSSGDFKVQLYDLETEANGMLTYDRAVWKVDAAVVRRACRGEGLAANVVDLVPCTMTRQTPWRYTLAKPAEGWPAPAFADAAWKEGTSGFGTPTGSAKLGTEWRTADIWLRKEFTLAAKPAAPLLRVLHDEDFEVYLNGVPACRDTGFSTAYDDYDVDAKAAAALQPGRNVIAVHCRQTVGGQFIDVGLVDRK